MSVKQFITRKDIAAKLGVPVRTVRHNERKWGLDKARLNLSTKPVLYHLSVVNAILGIDHTNKV